MLNKFGFSLLVIFFSMSFVKAQSNSEIEALVNGRTITQRDIDDSVTGQLFPLQQQIYVLRKTALENLIVKAVLEEEAKKRGVSIEELRKSLTAGKVEVSQSEVEKAYLENATAFAQMSPDEAKERIRLDMESQARMRLYREALKKLREQAKVEIKFGESGISAINVSPEGPAIGATQASVIITEFSDFQCPYCRESFKINKQILQAYGDNVKLIFKHLPLHSRSFPAARASFCANEQKRFWEYHDALFATEDMSDEGLSKTAEKLDLNMPKFNACLTSETSRQAVLKDLQEAKRLGIDGTPTFIVNGKMFRGAIGLEDFKQIIENELKTTQKSSGK